jgi:hypothetical protein
LLDGGAGFSSRRTSWRCAPAHSPVRAVSRLGCHHLAAPILRPRRWWWCDVTARALLDDGQPSSSRAAHHRRPQLGLSRSRGFAPLPLRAKQARASSGLCRLRASCPLEEALHAPPRHSAAAAPLSDRAASSARAHYTAPVPHTQIWRVRGEAQARARCEQDTALVPGRCYSTATRCARPFASVHRRPARLGATRAACISRLIAVQRR